MIQWWLWLWLWLLNSALAQTTPVVPSDPEPPAAFWAGEVESAPEAEWETLTLQVSQESEASPPGVLLLLGFDSIDSQTGRPVGGAVPVFELELDSEPSSFPRTYALWVQRDLKWYVLAAAERPAGADAWMSDELYPDLEAVDVTLGSSPREPDSHEGLSLGGDTGPGIGKPGTRMNWGGLLFLGLVPLAIGWALGPGTTESKGSLRQLLGHAVLAALVFVCMSEFWLVNSHLDQPYASFGFLESCDGVVSLVEPGSGWPAGRSRLAGLLPAAMAGWLGPMDALRVGAVISAAGVGAGIFVWARLVGGVVAGWAALAAALTLGPLTHLPRMLSFYPEMTVVLTWAGVATCGAILYPSLRSSVGAGVALGLCGLIDARGLPYVLILGSGLTVCHLVRHRRQAGWPMIALCLPLLFSWSLGRVVYPVDAVSLERQLLAFEGEAGAGGQASVSAASMAAETDQTDRHPSLVWGRTPPLEIPQSLGSLARSWPTVAESVEQEAGANAVATQVSPWLPVGFLALPLALWTAWRSRRQPGVGGLTLSILPSGLALCLTVDVLALTTQVPARFFTQLAPALAVCMGLAWVALLRAIPGEGKWAVATWVYRAILAGFLVGVVTGGLPSPLAPEAEWRDAWRAASEEENPTDRIRVGARGDAPTGTRCMTALGSSADVP